MYETERRQLNTNIYIYLSIYINIEVHIVPPLLLLLDQGTEGMYMENCCFNNVSSKYRQVSACVVLQLIPNIMFARLLPVSAVLLCHNPQ